MKETSIFLSKTESSSTDTVCSDAVLTCSSKEYKYGDCVIEYREFNSYKDIPDKADLKLAELKYYIQSNVPDFSKSIIDIESIYVEEDKRCTGVGSKALQEFCANHSDSIITLTAGLHQKDEYKLRLVFNDEELIDCHRQNIVNRLVKFYKGHNFIDVNDFIGNYYCMRSMILYNSIFIGIGGTNLFSRKE